MKISATRQTLELTLGVFTCTDADAHISTIQALGIHPRLSGCVIEANERLILEERHHFCARALADAVIKHHTLELTAQNIYSSLLYVIQDHYAHKHRDLTPGMILDVRQGDVFAKQYLLERAFTLADMLNKYLGLFPKLLELVEIMLDGTLEEPLDLDTLVRYSWRLLRATKNMIPGCEAIVLDQYSIRVCESLKVFFSSYRDTLGVSENEENHICQGASRIVAQSLSLKLR